MLRTETEEFLVHKKQSTYFWFEVLHGEDQGRRVTIPRRHPEYSEDVQQMLSGEVVPGDVVEAVLVSESESSPSWRVEEIERVDSMK